MYLIAVGAGGIKPCVSSFGGDQFRDDSALERGWRSSFFNWFYFAINTGALLSATIVVWLMENVSSAAGFAVPTAAFGLSISAFVLGAALRLYTVVAPGGSPVTRILRVLRGAWVNRKLPAPAFVDELYEPSGLGGDGEAGGGGDKEKGGKGKAVAVMVMGYTERFRALDKAAVVGDDGTGLATRSQVEE